MTISAPVFTRLQDGIKSVDDLRVRGPVNAAIAWLGGDLVTQLNAHFNSISNSLSQINSTLASVSSSLLAISQSVSVQISVHLSNRPTFFAHKNAVDQTSISAVLTPLTFSTEEWDTGNYFASNVWTPPAGKYRLTAQIYFQNANGVANETLIAVLTKNGGSHRQLDVVRASATNEIGLSISAIVSANGTDTFGAGARKTGAGVGTVEGDSDRTFFCGEAV